MTADELGPITNTIFSFLMQHGGDLELVNEKLVEVIDNRKSYQCEELAMWLRITGAEAKRLPAWESLLFETGVICVEQGFDPDDVLFGMWKDIHGMKLARTKT